MSKKIILNTFTTLLASTLVTVMAVSAVFAAAPSWKLDTSTVYTLTNTCVSGPCAGGPYPHTMNLSSFNETTGNFTASGFWNDDPSYTWNMTGNISDSSMTYELEYTGTGAGFVITAVGSIDSDGDMSGTSTGTNGENMTWTIEPNALPINLPAECNQSGSYNVINGTSGSDNINGTSGNDLIFAMEGSDRVDGKGGDDCIVGGDGSDRLIGGNGADVILGGNGSDSISGGASADDLYGESGSDSISGDGGNDDIFGGDNSDSLKGNAGTDSTDGGAGSDSCNAETETTCEA